MIGMKLPEQVTDLATRAVEALERIADAAEAIDRGMTQQRLAGATRERMGRDRSEQTEDGPMVGATCPVDPQNGDLGGEWPGVFGTPCNRPLGVRGNCAKSLGHSGRCKP